MKLKKKISKETSQVNDSIDQMDLADIYRISTQHPQNTHSSQ
jgi:hypothetical protein